MGGTGPATIAGSTITNNVECIAGIVLAQLIKPGTPLMVADFVHPMDMRWGHPAFGAVECALHEADIQPSFSENTVFPCINGMALAAARRLIFRVATKDR